jgi:glycine/D-amino acid oxidase-like deaminating enzyme/nitrite reductase/ring-hydroxylating ferredoxin subunit
MAHTAQSGSIWLATSPATSYPSLTEDVEVDVAVVGAGIAGLTAALELKRRGLTVAVLEAARVATGVTGNTTGKVTSLHRLAYSQLADQHGRAKARAYGQANQAAIEHVARTVAAEGIECGFRRVANYTYAESDSTLAKVRAEAELTASLDLPATFTTDVPLPFATSGAVRFDHQAQIHAVNYLQGLGRAVDGEGSFVVEGTRVRRIKDGSPAEVVTEGGTVRSHDVIVATNVPLGDGGRFAERLSLHRSYIVASPVRGFPADATFISVDEPMRSLLAVNLGGTDYVLVGGEGHLVPGGGDTSARFDRLAGFAKEHLGAEEPAYRWSTQDAMPVDGLPFAGPMLPDSQHVYAITGLRKWGLTNGTAGALVVADLITGGDNPWIELFDTNREVTAKAAASSSDAPTEAPEPDKALGPGEGIVVEIGGEPTAVYRDDHGSLRTLTAVCTHLGCTVEFNGRARTWDCPCHGSRFALDGTVIQGPAEKDLAHRDISVQPTSKLLW